MRRSPPALLVVIGALVLALPATGTPTARDASTTIRLISTPERTASRDLPPKGTVSKGDRLSGTSVLRNAIAQLGKPKGAVVGSDSYAITITSPPRALVTVRVKLPGGTLRAEGRTSVAKSPIVIPVVGGTGAFAGARGTSTASSLSAGRSLNVYRLRLP